MAQKRILSLEAAQTSMLQWLRRRGHRVDFRLHPLFTPELPHQPSRFIGSTLGLWDGKPCPYCGSTMMLRSLRAPTRDHKLPQSRAGKGFDHTANIIVVCRPCNGDKGAMTLEEFAGHLARRNDPRAYFVRNLLRKSDRQF